MTQAADHSSTRVPLAANLGLPPGKTDAIYFDDQVIGFGLRVRAGAGGKLLRSWIVQFRAGGRARRMRIGDAATITLIQARKKAKTITAQVTLGNDPQGDRLEELERGKVTLKMVATDYVEHKRPSLKPNSYAMLHHYLLGQLPGPHKNWRSKKNVDSWLKPYHSKPAHAVTKADISLAIKKAEENSGKPSAIALRSAVSSMFAWAIREGTYGVGRNPVIDARKIETDDTDDDEDDATGRVLSEGELVKLWLGVDADSDYGKIIRLLILSCCRRSEVGGLRWSEIDDPENPTRITIPPERLKNGKRRRKKNLGPLVVPVTPAIAEIIRSVHPRAESDHLFGGWSNSGYTSWSRDKRAVDKEIRIAAWKHHHLRRITTNLADLGTPPHITEEILGHTSGGTRDSTARRYDRSNYPTEVRAALEMWSLHILELVQRDPKMFSERTGQWLIDA